MDYVYDTKSHGHHGLLGYFGPYGLLSFPWDNGVVIAFIVGKDMALYSPGAATFCPW